METVLFGGVSAADVQSVLSAREPCVMLDGCYRCWVRIQGLMCQSKLPALVLTLRVLALPKISTPKTWLDEVWIRKPSAPNAQEL